MPSLSSTFPSIFKLVAFARRDTRQKLRAILVVLFPLSYCLVLMSYCGMFEVGYIRYKPDGPPPIYLKDSLNVSFGGLAYSHDSFHLEKRRPEMHPLIGNLPIYSTFFRLVHDQQQQWCHDGLWHAVMANHPAVDMADDLIRKAMATSRRPQPGGVPS